VKIMTEKKEKETQEQSKELQTGREGQQLATITPFGFVRRFAEDMERLFEDFEGLYFPSLFTREFFPFRKELAQVDWVPKIEVLQHNGQVTVRADLPGLSKDDVKVEITDEALIISGERKEEKEEKREGYYRSERSYGRFYRRIPLPQGVNADKAMATFNNGALEITMQAPKAESHIRRIEVKEAAETAMARAATGK
jgi:HSP20 family protein